MNALSYSHHLQAPSVRRVPFPGAPGAGELLVRVHAASLNPADYKSAAGEQAALLSFEWPRVVGFDFSGVVVEVGGGAADGAAASDTPQFVAGDAVFGMIRGLPEARRGTCAEFVLVDACVCARKPAAVPHHAAAALPLVGITVVKAFRACGLAEVDTAAGAGARSAGAARPRVLVLGGAGGTGSCALQIARAFFGAAHVATTASAGAKTDLCRRLGADDVVDYRTRRFERELAGGRDALFDAVLDTTGEAGKCPPLLREGGGLCSIDACPTVQGVREWLAEARIAPSRVTCGARAFLHSGTGGALFDAATGARRLRARCAARGATYRSVIGTGDGAIVRRLAALLEAGSLRAEVQCAYAMPRAAEALAELRRGRVAGKLVVVVTADAAAQARAAGVQVVDGSDG
eukprot:g1460.t1